MEQAFLIISILACIVSVGLFFTLRKTYYLFTFAAMLLLPKVNLFVVSGFMTGIRAEDLLLLFFLIGHTRGIWEMLKKNKPLLFLTALVVALVGAGFVSTALGASAGTVARELVSLLASVRKGEYFVTLFLGVYLIRTVDTRTLVRWISHVAVILTPICILQRKALLGYFYAGGYISKKSLPAAVFNGPYEYAAVCCLLFVVALVLLLRARDFHIKRDWYGILGLGLLFFQLCSTQSRTVLAVCVTVAFVAAVFYKGGRRARLALLLAVCLVLVVFLSMPSLLERLLHIDLAAMKETVQKAFAERDYFAALENLPYESDIANNPDDLSFLIRMGRWAAAIDGFLMRPLLGYGPGQLSAVEGAYIKLLGEGGILSLLLFVLALLTVFVMSIRRGRHEAMWALFVLLGFAVFSDVFDASRVMQLFWTVAAAAMIDPLAEAMRQKQEERDRLHVCTSDPAQIPVTEGPLPRCLVMLCTYNGEKYLREQIDSVLGQVGVEVHLRVADDCSSDGTCAILQEYRERYPDRVDWYQNEENKRFTYNFIDLFFANKDTDYDYYALCDQDDVWLPDKLRCAIYELGRLPDHKHGHLYCSNLTVTDGNLVPFSMMEGEEIRRAGYATFPFENIATGCTVVMDRAFQRHSTRYYPLGIHLHDYWLFLVAAYTAEYVYDTSAYILYRQHGGNQIGHNKKLVTLSGAKKLMGYHGPQCHLMEELVRGYGEDISHRQLPRIIAVKDYKHSIVKQVRLFAMGECHTTTKTLVLKCKVLFKKL